MNPARLRPIPPTGLSWESLIPSIGRANRALARYGGLLSALPNPSLLLSPLTTREAVLSSRIEGTQATVGEVLRFEAGDLPRQESRLQDIHEIQNYRSALRLAERELARKPFGLNLLRQLHHELMDSVRGRDRAPGEFRRVQNWVGPPGSTIATATFVPPPPQDLTEHLGTWERYYHSDQPDALVQLAILHAQFELIHPFLDGNGRIGRLVVPLFLFEKRLLTHPMFYVSDWLERHRVDYYRHLHGLSAESPAWDSWVAFFLKAVEEQANANVEAATSILRLYDRLKDRLLEISRSPWSIRLLDAMFRAPVFTTGTLDLKKPAPTRPALNNLLRTLTADGILRVLQEGAGRRGTVYAVKDLLKITEGRSSSRPSSRHS